MIKPCLATALACALLTTAALAQTAPRDSAHTLATPTIPAPSRPGQVVPLRQGGTGVTSGGTSSYKTLTTPGGSGVMTPGAGGTSNIIIGSGGRNETVTTPR
ncbi:MAG: hypothetical protein ACJ8AI_16635 [Rhodopila sp.]